VGNADVYEIEESEIDQAYEEGTPFLLTLHPFVTGRRSQYPSLDRLATHEQSKPGVWLGTLCQAAAAAKTQLK